MANRSGVSPLIATVILVALTVIIGTMLTATFTGIFGRQAATIEREAAPECQFVALNVRNANFNASATPPRLTFDLENTKSASVRITGIRIAYTDKNSSLATISQFTLQGNDRVPIVIDSTDSGNVRSSIEFVRILNPCQTFEISGSKINGTTP